MFITVTVNRVSGDRCGAGQCCFCFKVLECLCLSTSSKDKRSRSFFFLHQHHTLLSCYVRWHQKVTDEVTTSMCMAVMSSSYLAGSSSRPVASSPTQHSTTEDVSPASEASQACPTETHICVIPCKSSFCSVARRSQSGATAKCVLRPTTTTVPQACGIGLYPCMDCRSPFHRAQSPLLCCHCCPVTSSETDNEEGGLKKNLVYGREVRFLSAINQSYNG